MSRTDSVTYTIEATPETIYAALVDPDAMAIWRPPAGMTGKVLDFDPTPGGRLRMALDYDDPAQHGKSGDNRDIFESRFVKLIPNESVVEEVAFDSRNPAFAGIMTVTTSLSLGTGGTEVTIACTNVPSGIGEADHLAGLASTLENLARYCT
ncbi:SRPBCC domain-containing protein [Devosia sp. 2618]|uniref:SRPBCC domain-containing protein n=1 Tax=Devosia sp. 2618 TaxID=3156454 RepID=UPI0033972012